MREERQWLMANGESVPEELKMSFGKEEESKESEPERRPKSPNKQNEDDIGLEDRDEDLYTGMYKGSTYTCLCYVASSSFHLSSVQSVLVRFVYSGL